MRIVSGGIQHDTSTFATVPTTLSDFQRDSDCGDGLVGGDRLRELHAGTGKIHRGYLDGAAVRGIEVRRSHRGQPGNIVGAIANEAGIGNQPIGKIRTFDRFSAVDLLANFPQDLLETLRNVMIAGQRFQMSRMADSRPARGHIKDGKRPHNKPFKKTKSKPKRRKKT